MLDLCPAVKGGDSVTYGLEEKVWGVSRMAVPKFEDFYRPVLELVSESRDHITHKELFGQLVSRLSLTEKDQKVTTKAGTRPQFESHARFAVFYLRKVGLLQSIERGHISITSLGKGFLRTHDGPIRDADLHLLISDEGHEFIPQTLQPSHAEAASPDAQLAAAYQVVSDQLADEVLENVKSVSPESFERIVNRLLNHMGYGEIDRETGHSGDQGFDGILNQDRLGLEKVYVQAKRYDTAQVGEPEIRTFSGSLDWPGALKGIFVTTSSFLRTARQSAEDISKGSKTIRLIDGEELAQLMIQHGVGVVTEITYEVKKLDANYFAELQVLTGETNFPEQFCCYRSTLFPFVSCLRRRFIKGAAFSLGSLHTVVPSLSPGSLTLLSLLQAIHLTQLISVHNQILNHHVAHLHGDD